MAIKEKLIKDTFINGSFDVFAKAIELLAIPFIILFLGQISYGIFALIISFILETNVFEFGVGSYVTKKIAEFRASNDSHSEIKNIVKTMLSFNLTVGIITGTVLFLFNYFMFAQFFNVPTEQRASAILLFSLMIIYLILKMASANLPRILQGCQEFLLLQRALLLEKVVRLSLILLFLKMGFGLVGMGCAYILGLFVGIALQIIYAKRVCPQALCFVPGIDWKILRQSLSFSTSLFVGKIAALVFYKANIWIIGYMLDLRMIAFYQIAVRLWQIPSMFLGYMNSTVLPATSRLSTTDSSRLPGLFKKGTYYSVSLSMPLLVIMFVLAEQIVQVWMGPGYEISATLLRFLLVTTAAYTIWVEFGKNMMIGLDRYKYILKYILIGSVLALLSSIILVKKVGVVGVTWGMMVGGLVMTYFHLSYYLKTFSMKALTFFEEIAWKPLAISTAFSFIFFYLSQMCNWNSLISLIAVSTIGLIIFGGLFLTFGVKESDRRLIQDFLKNMCLRIKNEID